MRIGVILAGGKSSRFKSDVPKGLHKIGGKSIVSRILEFFNNAGIEKTYIVVSDSSYEYYSKENFDVQYVFQKTLNGTGSAFYCVNGLYDDNDVLVVVNSDCFIFDRFELLNFCDCFENSNFGVGLISKKIENCYGYGRVVVKDDFVKVVEQSELDDTNKDINSVNLGVYAFKGSYLAKYMKTLNNDSLENKITTLLEMDRCYVHKTENLILCLNTKKEYGEINKLYYLEVCEKLMSKGVKIYDVNNTYIDENVIVGENVEIWPNNYILGNTCIGANSVILPNCCIDNSCIGDGCSIGPFSNIKKDSKISNNVTIGGFVEVKNSEIYDGVKAKHHAYLGDVRIGERTNIGCGVIIANYDGKSKHSSSIGSNSFIGCNTVIVSPVNIGDNVVVGAGSTIVENINSNALAIARNKQINKENYYSN